jgi:transposase
MAESGARCNDLDVVRTKESCHGILRWIGRGSGRNQPLHRGRRRQNGTGGQGKHGASGDPLRSEGYADRLSRIGVEVSSLGPWLYRELQVEGLPIIVVEARHMRVSLSTMRNNRNDARGIAQMMRLGWFRAVHVKNVEMQKMRTLLTNRKLLKRKLVDIENHIRGALRTYGVGRSGAFAGGSARSDLPGRSSACLGRP